MDYKCVVLMLCLTGVLSQTIVDYDRNPVGGTTGDVVELVCGITSVNEVLWTHPTLGTVYSSATGQSTAGFEVVPETIGSTQYFNLKFTSATKEQAGTFTCNALADEQPIQVLIFDPPVFSTNQIVAGVDTTLSCEVTYGAPSADETLFTFQMENWNGNILTEHNDTVDETGGITALRRVEYTVPDTFTWEDDGEEFACVIEMTNYHENTTSTLSVLHTAANITLDPADSDMNYYVTEDVTVLYSSNPAAKQWQWYRRTTVSPEAWELIDGDDDQDATIRIQDWPADSSGFTVLEVRITNAFDGNADGTITDQMGNQTFEMRINPCCRTDDAGHLSYSVLMTTLFAILAAVLLDR